MHPIHLCIGAPRAGTTWLFREMSEHPALFVPRVKEVRYWNSRRSDAHRDLAVRDAQELVAQASDRTDQERWLADWQAIDQRAPQDMEEYLRLMSVEGRPSLDITPAYCFLPPHRIAQLREGLPEGSKVLYLLRDPLDRMSSQVKLHFHLHGMYRGNPSRADLEHFLSNESQQRRWDYAAVMENWGSVFGEDFIALPFDDVTRDPRSLTSRVAQILGFDLAADNENRDDASFHHAEENQNTQPWLSRLRPAQKQILAQAMLPAIRTFAGKMPDPGQAWLARLEKQAAVAQTWREPAEVLPLAVEKLMRMTESLGDNCEYGFWQRHRAYEPSSLFRWAITPLDSLLAYLADPAPLFAADKLSVHSPGMVDDATFGFKFHSKLVEPDGSGGLRLVQDSARFAEIHADESGKIAHLEKKFFAQMRRQAAVYVVKANAGLPEDKVEALLAHLRRHNREHRLLWAIAGGAADAPVEIEEPVEGLLKVALPDFAPYVTADAYHADGWSRVMIALSAREDIAGMIAKMQR